MIDDNFLRIFSAHADEYNYFKHIVESHSEKSTPELISIVNELKENYGTLKGYISKLVVLKSTSMPSEEINIIEDRGDFILKNIHRLTLKGREFIKD